MHIVSDISNDTKADNSRELSNIWIYSEWPIELEQR